MLANTLTIYVCDFVAMGAPTSYGDLNPAFMLANILTTYVQS